MPRPPRRQSWAWAAAFLLALGAAAGGVRAQVPSLDELAGEWMPVTRLRDTPAISNWRGSVGTNLDILDTSSFIAPPFVAGASDDDGTGD